MLFEKLTIAIPVWNDAKYIGQTLDSCLKNAAHIKIYDNASTDGTSEICATYAEKYAQIKHIRHEKNLGAFENFKKPLFACQTEYFAWLGSHDLHGPSYTEKLLKLLENNPEAVLAVGKIQHIGENGETLDKLTTCDWLKQMELKTPLEKIDIFIKNLRDCFMIHGIFRTKAAQKAWLDVPCLGNDEAMLIRTAALGEIVYSPECILYARKFNITRKKLDPNIRRIQGIVGENQKPLERNLFLFCQNLISTVWGYVSNEKDMTLAFELMDTINKRYHRPKYFKNRRQKLKIALGLGALLFILAIIF